MSNLERNLIEALNKSLLNRRIDSSDLLSMKRDMLFNNITLSLNNNDILFMIKMEHIVNYIVYKNITTFDNFSRNIDDLLLYSNNNNYDKNIIDELHDMKNILSRVKLKMYF